MLVRARISSRRGVQTGLGPSSKVRAIWPGVRGAVRVAPNICEAGLRMALATPPVARRSAAAALIPVVMTGNSGDNMSPSSVQRGDGAGQAGSRSARNPQRGTAVCIELKTRAYTRVVRGRILTIRSGTGDTDEPYSV